MRAPYKGGSGQTGTDGKVGEFCCLSETNHREWRGSPLCNLANLKLAWVRVDANDKCASMYVTAAARLRALPGGPAIARTICAILPRLLRVRTTAVWEYVQSQ